MHIGVGTKIIGWIFLIVTALGFEFENAPIFLAGLVLLFAWIGFVLRPANRPSAHANS